MSHSIYMIRLPVELPEIWELDAQGFMSPTNTTSLSPILTFPKRNSDSFIPESAMFKLGTRIYFLGGDETFEPSMDPPNAKYKTVPDESKLAVRFLDTNNPDKLHSVAPMNAPKQTPCVFAGPDGMMNVLGVLLKRNINQKYEKGRSGCFERYDPESDKWEILPDPPLWEYTPKNWCDCATVVDNFALVGNPGILAIFKFDTQHWVKLRPLAGFQFPFPYGSLYADKSLYYLRGHNIWKVGTVLDENNDKYIVNRNVQVELVKRGPFHMSDHEHPFMNLVEIPCLLPDSGQVMATIADLDEDIFFTGINFHPWREIFHLGGPFFCYVYTTQLAEYTEPTMFEYNSRGLWIKVFQEVQDPENKGTAFRPLASFCYKISTPFRNYADFTRCCAFGTVPSSWIKAQQPPRRKPLAREFEADCGTEKERDEIRELKKRISNLEAKLAKRDQAPEAL